MDKIEQNLLTEMDLSIDAEVRQQLQDTAKWTKFISIVVFVLCGFLLLVGVLAGATMFSVFEKMGAWFNFLGNFGAGIFVFILLVIVAVIALVYYFLFNFSQKIKTALLTENTEQLNSGLKSLKIFFIITTVFAVITLLNSLYKLFILI